MSLEQDSRDPFEQFQEVLDGEIGFWYRIGGDLLAKRDWGKVGQVRDVVDQLVEAQKRMESLRAYLEQQRQFFGFTPTLVEEVVESTFVLVIGEKVQEEVVAINEEEGEKFVDLEAGVFYVDPLLDSIEDEEDEEIVVPETKPSAGLNEPNITITIEPYNSPFIKGIISYPETRIAVVARDRAGRAVSMEDINGKRHFRIGQVPFLLNPEGIGFLYPDLEAAYEYIFTDADKDAKPTEHKRYLHGAALTFLSIAERLTAAKEMEDLPSNFTDLLVWVRGHELYAHLSLEQLRSVFIREMTFAQLLRLNGRAVPAELEETNEDDEDVTKQYVDKDTIPDYLFAPGLKNLKIRESKPVRRNTQGQIKSIVDFRERQAQIAQTPLLLDEEGSNFKYPTLESAIDSIYQDQLANVEPEEQARARITDSIHARIAYFNIMERINGLVELEETGRFNVVPLRPHLAEFIAWVRNQELYANLRMADIKRVMTREMSLDELLEKNGRVRPVLVEQTTVPEDLPEELMVGPSGGERPVATLEEVQPEVVEGEQVEEPANGLLTVREVHFLLGLFLEYERKWKLGLNEDQIKQLETRREGIENLTETYDEPSPTADELIKKVSAFYDQETMRQTFEAYPEGSVAEEVLFYILGVPEEQLKQRIIQRLAEPGLVVSV